MTWPTSAVPTTNLDAGADNPQLARPDLLLAAQNINKIAKHFGDPEVALASATSTDLGGQTVNRVVLTGSVAITSLGANYSGPVFVRVGASSAPTLTYNATSLITHTGADLVLQPGDTFVAYPKATSGTADGWVVTDFQRGAGLLSGSAAKTANYTVVASDRGRLIDCTSGTFTLTLTAAATLGDGFAFAVRNSGSGVITIDPNGAELIDGAATITLAAGETAFVMCTGGTAFKTISRITTPMVLGVGQTWQDVLASRAAATDYPNSTGRPIQVNIWGVSGAAADLVVGGVVACRSGINSSVPSVNLTAVVPPGATYRVNNITTGSIVVWAELR